MAGKQAKEGMLVSRTEYATTTLFVFGMGLVIGGLIFSGKQSIPNPRLWGDPATWFGAFGTWVVGYMAWRIGTTSHAQKLREYEDKLRVEDLARRHSRANTLARVSQLQGIIDLYNSLSTRPTYLPGIRGQAEKTFDAKAITTLDAVHWSAQEFSDFGAEEQRLLNTVGSTCGTLRFHIDRLRGITDGSHPSLMTTIGSSIRKLERTLDQLWAATAAADSAANSNP